MEKLRDSFLTCAAFARDEDRGIDFRYAPRELDKFPKSLTVGDDSERIFDVARYPHERSLVRVRGSTRRR